MRAISGDQDRLSMFVVAKGNYMELFDGPKILRPGVQGRRIERDSVVVTYE
jgi:hypothetical protein